MVCKYTGTDKPTLRLLIKYCRDKVAPHWYDFGIWLLENECVDKLNIIEKHHPGDVERCCTEMFNYWLKIDNEASWNKIVDALEGIGQDVAAKKIKDLTKGSYVKFIKYVYNMLYFMLCHCCHKKHTCFCAYILCEICVVARLVVIVGCLLTGAHARSCTNMQTKSIIEKNFYNISYIHNYCTIIHKKFETLWRCIYGLALTVVSILP